MVIYTLDNKNLKTEWGVKVSKTTGLVGLPDFKTPFTMDWNDQNGTWIDLEHRKYKNRTITMECFIRAGSEYMAFYRYNKFIKYFEGIHTLRVRFDHGTNLINNSLQNLVYKVYLEKSEVSYKWRVGQNIMKFKLTLVECEPSKTVLSVGIVNPTSGTGVTHVMPEVKYSNPDDDCGVWFHFHFDTTPVGGGDTDKRINITLPDGTNTGDIIEFEESFFCPLEEGQACDLIISGDVKDMRDMGSYVSETNIPEGCELAKCSYTECEGDVDFDFEPINEPAQ